MHIISGGNIGLVRGYNAVDKLRLPLTLPHKHTSTVRLGSQQSHFGKGEVQRTEGALVAYA